MRKILLLFTMCFALLGSAYAQTITGKVIAEDGTGVPGATVVQKGTNNGAVSDVDGNYSIKAAGDATLVFSFVGMKTQEVQVAGRSVVNVTMLADAVGVDEVVVTALGIRKETKALGYAVSKVAAVDLVKTGTPNFATSLYGKASGVQIQAAPGGSTSAVSINVRGLSSITGNNQPLIIMDGVPIRNGNANTDGYWTDQRVNSNGLVDINPEDIEDITILKGASASALYGSEAANGVVMITTKSGKGAEGIEIDVNANLSFDQIAYMPKIQTEFGPGYPQVYWGEDTGEWETGGFYTRDGKKSIRRTSYQWGPKYDGSEVYYWDGKMRKYEPVDYDQWDEIFRTGVNQTYNVSIRSAGKKSNTRFSYTFAGNKPTQQNSSYSKHNFSLNGGMNLSEKLKLDYTANYIRQDIKNRPYRISRLTNNYNGMFGSFEDVALIRDMTMTSLGYKNVYGDQDTPTPDESFAWQPYGWALMDEYFWNILGKEQFEANNRFIASVTPSWTIAEGLNLRGRVSTDLTSEAIERNEFTTKPLSYGTATGNYSLTNKRYEIYYGDLLLMYEKDLTEKIGLSAYVGMQGRQEQQFNTTVSTNGGLTVENWFHISASKNTANATMVKTSYLKTAVFGSASLSYNNMAFLEGTLRQEKTSTLKEGNNTFVYPSVNASVIFSEALADRYSWYDYGKVRVSYGIVGNDPGVYAANMAYTQDAISGYIYNTVGYPLGNESLKPETKYEWEIGLENKFFKNRLGVELSYYTNRVEDQILQTTMPQSAGATSINMNIGELENKGFEASIYGTPIKTADFSWDLNFNFAWNQNKIVKLASGLDELSHGTYDGAVELKSVVGESMGDFYAYTTKKDDNGNKIIGDDGLYVVDFSERKKVGNAMPKLVGGLNSAFNYKNFFLDATIDFRIGGAVLNQPYQYMMEIGNIEESLEGREGHGGKSYYFADNNVDDVKNIVRTSAASGPNGEMVFHDGIVLDGVNEDGSKNDQMIPVAYYNSNSYGWGSSGSITYENAIADNSYVKLRELSFGYNVPKSIYSKIGCTNLSLSVYGRNLFYFYKNLPMMDAECTDGTSWTSQAIIGGSTATTRSYGISLRASF
ncbi:MAG: SusC/RagA family TonB-linked outer membrane protein [Mangrovibacterium sp.]